MVLLISYDLNGRERPAAYALVKRTIESNAISYRKPLYSQWFVETEYGPDAWVEMLRKVMDSDDGLFVIRVRPPYQGWIDRSIWAWLSARAI